VDEDMIKKEESAQGSSHINLEIAFAYLAAKDDSNKANNIHLLIEFFLGVCVDPFLFASASRV
jgi:hypothetical protein